MKIKIVLLFAFFLYNFGFSKNDYPMMNPILANFGTVHNTLPFTKITTEHFKPAFDIAFKIAKTEIDQIIDNADIPSFDNTILALAYSGGELDRVSNVLFNLNSAETNEQIQALAREISPVLTDFNNDITLNEKLFKKVQYVFDHTDKSSLTAEQLTLLTKTYKGFVRSGANLKEEEKEKFRAISKELSELTVKFGENVLAETNSYLLHITDSTDLAGLPEGIVDMAAADAKSKELEGWVFTLQFPSFGPFLQYADNRKLREQIAIASKKRGANDNDHDNKEIIRRIVELRLEKAKVLGYNTYADFVLEERMAENTGRVFTFLDELLETSITVARNEYSELSDYAATLGFNSEIQSWDWAYYAEKLKKEKFNVDDEVTRPYFQLEKMTEAVFGLATKLWGLTFKENKEIQVYHEDVLAYEVFDADGSYLSVLYMDFFPREGKRNGAWMTEFQSQKRKDGLDIRPHVSLVFNFTKPTSTKPSLITHRELETLFHEFGHGLHGMLSSVTYPGLSGTSVYWDFVELPSQIMENWASQREWLDQVAVHYQTGEKIPDDLLKNIIDSKNFNSGSGSVRQLSFGYTDMAWHTLTEAYKGSIEQFEIESMKKTELFPHIPGTMQATAFGHLFSGGYAAGYYSYKWAEVLDADAFSVFLEKGIFNTETAALFREQILSKGGTEHPMILYKRFRGQEPSIKPLLVRSGLM